MNRLARPLTALALIAASLLTSTAMVALDARAAEGSELAFAASHDEKRCAAFHDHDACTRIGAETAAPIASPPPSPGHPTCRLSVPEPGDRAHDATAHPTLPRAPPIDRLS